MNSAALAVVATLLAGASVAALVLLMRPPLAGVRRPARQMGWREGVLTPVVLLLVLVLTFGGWDRLWWEARQGTRQLAQLAETTSNHALGVRQHLEDHRQPSKTPAKWLELQMRDLPFPLAPLDEAAIDAEQGELAAGFQLAPPVDGKMPKGQCQYRVWDSLSGDEAHPLLVYHMFEAPNQAGQRHASVVGFARAADGGRVKLAVPNSSSGDRSPFLGPFFFGRDALVISLAPVGKHGEVEPPDLRSGDTSWIDVDPPITPLEWSRTKSTSLRHAEDDRFELRLDTPDGPLLRTARLNWVRLASNETERKRAQESSAYLAQRISWPDRPPGQEPYPVELDPNVDAFAQHRTISSLQLRPRSHEAATWLRDHPDSRTTYATLVLTLDPQVIELPAGIGFSYRTNYRSMVRLVGRLNCGPQPPGEFGPFLSWLEHGAVGY